LPLQIVTDRYRSLQIVTDRDDLLALNAQSLSPTPVAPLLLPILFSRIRSFRTRSGGEWLGRRRTGRSGGMKRMGRRRGRSRGGEGEKIHMEREVE
jgi:hypothetical protein